MERSFVATTVLELPDHKVSCEAAHSLEHSEKTGFSQRGYLPKPAAGYWESPECELGVIHSCIC
ncbi:hypothetical protein GCM10022249_23030 [Enteractinococcus coprophilus]